MVSASCFVVLADFDEGAYHFGRCFVIAWLD